MNYTPYDIAKLMPSTYGYASLELDLKAGETAWNPCSTKRENDFRGPARVTYESFSDGGWNVRVEDLPSAEAA